MYYHNPLSENRRAVFKKLIRKHLLRPARGTVPRKAILEDRVELPLPIEGGPIVLRRLRGDEDTYFVGSPTGMHRVSNMRTSHEITVHWEGYVDNAARSVEGFLRHYEAILALLEEADPTPTGSYATWVFKMLRTKQTSYEDAQTLHEMLSEFDAKKHRLPPELRDINSYAKPGDVSRALREHFQESARGRFKRLVEEGIELIYEQDGLLVYRITTPEAANRVAQKTQWCVKDERIATNYLSEAPLYYIDITPEHNNDESDIQYPVLAHAGNEIQIRDVDDNTISTDYPDDLDAIKKALLAADQKFVCSTHNELKLRECETCYSAGICPDCGEVCTECNNTICDNCSQDCYVCTEPVCRDCKRSCDQCQQEVDTGCINVCRGCSNTHICDDCAQECCSCGDKFCNQCTETCANCTEPVCKRCSDICNWCDQPVGSGCSIPCEDCGNQACDDAEEHCSDGSRCTHCINEAKENSEDDEDDNDYRRRWNPMDPIPWEDEWDDAPFNQQCAWVQLTRRPLSYERCHRLASADSPIGGLCMKHLKLYRNLERERVIADEGYDPWQDADDETREGRHNPFWDRAKNFVKGSMRLGGKMIPFMNVPPSVVRNFGSWALDYVIPRPIRDEFLRKLDAHLSMGREACLQQLGQEDCQKIENTAIALGKKWADTSRKVEHWMGRDGQFDATLDLFNQEMARALDKRRR